MVVCTWSKFAAYLTDTVKHPPRGTTMFPMEMLSADSELVLTLTLGPQFSLRSVLEFGLVALLFHDPYLGQKSRLHQYFHVRRRFLVKQKIIKANPIIKLFGDPIKVDCPTNVNLSRYHPNEQS